eukprot:m.164134 g.164134  ORF g.164134 m.164134 type:complete len:55 (-) comp13422_c0_seq1:1128-1292(-)
MHLCACGFQVQWCLKNSRLVYLLNLFTELIRLLRDPNGDVKQKGAEAMSLLYDY